MESITWFVISEIQTQRSFVSLDIVPIKHFFYPLDRILEIRTLTAY